MALGISCAGPGKSKDVWLIPVVGYGFAWVSHTFIEKNKPATFQYPLYSFLGDLRMWSEMIQMSPSSSFDYVLFIRCVL